VLLIFICTVQTSHITTQPLDHPATEYPTCVTILGPLHTMLHLSPAHHETSKRDSPHDTRIKVKQPKCPRFKFKPHQVNDSSQSNQGTDYLVSQSPLWLVHWQQKHKVRVSNPRPHEGQLDNQRPMKSSRGSSRRRGSRKTNKRNEKLQNHRKSKKNSKSAPPESTLPNTLNASSPNR
jgi:hypothetical protein